MLTALEGEPTDGVVLFWAGWAPPSTDMRDMMHALPDEFRHVDVEANPEAALKNDVRGLPTVVLYRRGVDMSRKIGYINEQALRAWIAEN